MIEQYIVYGYGALVAIGGLIGYLKANSIPSLVMGLFFGAAILASGFFLGRNHNAAFCAAIALSGFLTLFFGYRYYLTKNFMPAGLMAIVSLAVFVAIAAIRAKQS